MEIDVRPARATDAAALAHIYNHYVLRTCATFEIDPIGVEEMAGRLDDTSSRGLPWLVSESSERVNGYAYAAPWKHRSAYRHSVESTIYLDPGETSRGIGTRLYGQLVDALRELGLHAVVGGIALPNEPSIRLHEKLGFKCIGRFEEVGFKQERWVDVGYWELLL